MKMHTLDVCTLVAYKDVGKGREHDHMARIVPDNPVAFPPSMEVSVRGRANQDDYKEVIG